MLFYSLQTTHHLKSSLNAAGSIFELISRLEAAVVVFLKQTMAFFIVTVLLDILWCPVLKGRERLILSLSSCFGEVYIMVQFCALLFG